MFDVLYVVFNTTQLAYYILIVFDMHVQSEELVQQDQMGHQGHLEYHQVLFQDLLVGQVLQALQEDLDNRDLLDFQVMNFCLFVIYIFADYRTVLYNGRHIILNVGLKII